MGLEPFCNLASVGLLIKNESQKRKGLNTHYNSVMGRHSESSAKECAGSEASFHSARVTQDPWNSTGGNLGTIKGRDVWLEVNGSYKGSKADSERYQAALWAQDSFPPTRL